MTPRKRLESVRRLGQGGGGDDFHSLARGVISWEVDVVERRDRAEEKKQSVVPPPTCPVKESENAERRTCNIKERPCLPQLYQRFYLTTTSSEGGMGLINRGLALHLVPGDEKRGMVIWGGVDMEVHI